MSSGFRKTPLSLIVGAAFVIGLIAADPAFAQTVTSGTDPTTIINAGLSLATGPLGIGLATLGLIVMLCGIMRFGLGALLIYVGIVSGIFGSSYIVQQLTGGTGTGGG